MRWYCPVAAGVIPSTHLLRFVLCLFKEISDTGDTYRFIDAPLHTFSAIYFGKKNKMITIHFKSGDGRMGEESIVEIVLRV